MTKAFVSVAHIQNSRPASSLSGFELSGQRHHRTKAHPRIHLVPHNQRPVTSVLLDCPVFLFGPAGLIGHCEAFMSSFLLIYFFFLLRTFWGEAAEPAWGVPPSTDNKLLLCSITMYISLIHTSVIFKKIPWRVSSASTEKVGTAVKVGGMKYAKQAHHRE